MTIDSNGVRLAYSDIGHGMPVLLVHGFPLDRRVWEGVATKLAESVRVISVDLRGFGQSSPANEFSMRDLANDLADFVGRLRISPCVMAGLSMGGYVLQTLATYRPESIRRLILIDTKAEADNDEAKAKRDVMADLARTIGAAAVAAQMLPNMLRKNPDSAHVGLLNNIMQAQRAETIAAACIAMRDREDFRPMLSKRRIPVGLIYGTQDAITPISIGRSLQESVFGAKLIEIENAGHMSPVEQPDLVAKAILELMQ